MMRIQKIFFILFQITVIINAQDKFEEQKFVKNPVLAGDKIIFTDNYASKIYLLQNGKAEELISSPGIGSYFSVSPDKMKLGLKYIGEEGKQSPVLINLNSREITNLHSPVNQCGQVSFSGNGKIAFTVDKELNIIDETNIYKYNLEYYSNLTPISPDGNYVAFNDNDDQIWIINLVNKQKEKISDLHFGYFNPVWSPDSKMILYSSLSGYLKVYDLVTKKTYNIGEGYSASWSPDSKQIIFYRKEINDAIVTNTDIYIASFGGSEVINLTNSPDSFEMDARFISNDKIIYHTFVDKTINVISIDLKNNATLSSNELYNAKNLLSVNFYNYNSFDKPLVIPDVPYVHQVYDTPDWFYGHTCCGPTTAIMAIAYYNLLPKWEGWCSYPTGHYNNWGRYIADKYRFRMFYYALPATAGSTTGYGGYGYMWNSGSPYSRMSAYFGNHRISSSTTDAPPYSSFETEVNNGYTYAICNGLTTSGHIILGHSFGTASRSIITNDPYGNKNTPGYPSYDGKNAIYDWPGYNNGYQNLNTVYWASTVRYNLTPVSDSLVDDLDLERGFYLHTKSPASMERWRDITTVPDGHMWYTYTDTIANDISYAMWRLTIPQAGNYELFAFIPFSNAIDARYKVTHKDGTQTVSVNQSSYTNSWASLGCYNFNQGNTNYIRLGDASSVAGQEIVFDAIKWRYKGAFVSAQENEVKVPHNFSLEQNYPNPFNPSTTIRYNISSASKVILKVFDTMGNEIKTLVNEEKQPGSYEVEFMIEKTNLKYSAGSGVYFYQLIAGNFIETKKMVVIK